MSHDKDEKSSESNYLRFSLISRRDVLIRLMAVTSAFGITRALGKKNQMWLDMFDSVPANGELSVAAESPIIPSVAAYLTPDGFRHAIIATPSGKLQEIFYSPTKGKGISRLACFNDISHIDGFFASDDGYQIEIVATSDGNIYEIFFKPNDIHFTEKPLGNFKGIKDIAAFQTLDDKNRIVIVATDNGSVNEIYYRPSIGTHLTQPPLGKFNGIVGVAGFFAEDDKSRVVIVATNDGSLHEIYYRPSIGVRVSQLPIAKFNNIVDVAAFYAQDSKHRIIIVATADGNLYEVFYHPYIGVHLSQPPLTNLTGIIGVSAFYSKDDKNRIIIAATNDGKIQEVFYNSLTGVHISQPPLAHFSRPLPTVEDISPDPTNVDAQTLAGLAGLSSAGRVIGLAGSKSALYALMENSGVWKSVNGGQWGQLSAAPADAVLENSQIAVSPNNNNHIVLGNRFGAWESNNGGVNWNRLFDPMTRGCSTSEVFAVAFGLDDTLYLGTACGIASRRANTNVINFFNTTVGIRAFAISETKIFARGETSLFVLAENQQSWDGPLEVPTWVQFNSTGLFYRTPFSFAAFDTFAFLPFSTGGVPKSASCTTSPSCGSDVKILIFNSVNKNWAVQNVDFDNCHVCDGMGLGGRIFLKSFIRNAPNLRSEVGQKIQIFCSSAQELYQAKGVNSDGTFTGWNRLAVTNGSDSQPRTNVHNDIWDFNIDISVRGNIAWLASDGGISVKQAILPSYSFLPGNWQLKAEGLHTHQIHTLTVLPTTPISRSSLAYPTGDNNAWCRDSSPIVLPPAKWQGIPAGGDTNFTVGDAGLPQYALLVRHRSAATLKNFKGTAQYITIANGAVDDTYGPDKITRFQFIQAPRGQGSATLDAVMMIELPLTDKDGKIFDPNSPLGKSSNGKSVLIRNRNFNASPDMNISKGVGWKIEVSNFPSGAKGFYVTGTPASPIYYAFSSDVGGLILSKWNGSAWQRLPVTGLMSSFEFGPAFVNPYDKNVLYVITSSGIQLSTNGGNSFTLEQQLTTLIKGTKGLPMSQLAQIAFKYDNPSEIVAGTRNGGVFYNKGNGQWANLTNLVPTPHSPLVAVGIDSESIYIATDGRSLWRITDYRGA